MIDTMGVTDMEKVYERRVRIHVVGPLHRFAAIVAPEIAPVCLREIESLGIRGAELTEAGVEFPGRLKDAYACNLWLRTASRVLIRLPEFRAGISEEFFYKVSRIPWDLWIDSAIALDIESHVEYSRISHEGKAAELLADGIAKVFRERGIEAACVRGKTPEGAQAQRIILRLIRNHCQISLDTTGVHLHERGYRSMHTGAPLRETLAAAILLRSEWAGEGTLLDGMCGSGTFPIEAALIARKLPPGIERGFLFEKWPSFRKATLEYMRRCARESVLDKCRGAVVGIDRDPEAIRIAGENAARAGVNGDIAWKEKDFFDFDPRAEGLEPGLLVLNPPYGKRLEGGGMTLYEKLGPHLRRFYAGWKIAILAASRSHAAALRVGPTRMWSIRHGGLPVVVALGRVTP